MGVPKNVFFTAFNGEVALNIIENNVKLRNFKKTDFVLIIMDCNMPIMNGFCASSSIRELLHIHSIKQPIITGITGHTQDKYAQLAFKSGMNQILSKPPIPELLKDTLIQLKLLY